MDEGHRSAHRGRGGRREYGPVTRAAPRRARFSVHPCTRAAVT